MEPLKDMFNPGFYQHLSDEVKKHYPEFKSRNFQAEILNDHSDLSLNQRMRKTALTLGKYLPPDFPKAVSILKNVIPGMRRSYTNILFPDFISQFGKKHFDLSLDALGYFTKFGSSEFAIREFIKLDPDGTLNKMKEWSEDPDHHVRRLASEGSRPRLPWSFKLEEIIRHPEKTLPILEKLKADPELYVRKSVANHLNDFSKDNPEFMLKVIRSWDISNPLTSWIVKHASRGLIKKGHADSLSVFKFEKSPGIKVSKVKIAPKSIQIGDDLEFTFEITSQKSKPQKLAIDYVVHYRKKSGELSPKVFKLKEYTLGPEEKITLKKKQRFTDFSTRKHFPGNHLIEIQINGKIYGSGGFRLNNNR